MITILAKPPIMAFTGNPVIYDVQTNAYVLQDGSFAQVSLQVMVADTTEGHHFTLNFNGKAITFTVSVNDDGTGTIIPPAASGSPTAWAIVMFGVFLSNYELFMNYAITRTGNIIYFKARIKGTAYNMTMTNCTVPSLNYGHINGSDHLLQSNFGILATILDKDLVPIGQDFKPVDNDGKARFDVGEYLRSKLAMDDTMKMTFPEDALIVHPWPSLTLPYQVTFSEKKADTVMKMLTDTAKYSINGGVNREAEAAYNAAGTDFFTATQLSQQLPFLTWLPDYKKTGKSVPEKLFFLIYLSSGGTAQLKVKTYFSDGTTDTRSKGTPFNLSSFTVMELSVGYDQLDLAAIDPQKTVTAWEAWLVTPSNSHAISQVRHFILDTKHHRYERVFVFRNSFSVYDVVRFWGVREANNEYERTNGAVILNEKNTAQNAPLRQFKNTESQKFKCTSGWITREMKDYLREILLSTEIYEVKDGNLVRVLDETKKVMMFRDKEDNYKLDFEYEYAHTDEFYSGIPAGLQDEAAPDEEEWITVDSTEYSADSTEISADQTHT